MRIDEYGFQVFSQGVHGCDEFFLAYSSTHGPVHLSESKYLWFLIKWLYQLAQWTRVLYLLGHRVDSHKHDQLLSSHLNCRHGA